MDRNVTNNTHVSVDLLAPLKFSRKNKSFISFGHVSNDARDNSIASLASIDFSKVMCLNIEDHDFFLMYLYGSRLDYLLKINSWHKNVLNNASKLMKDFGISAPRCPNH